MQMISYVSGDQESLSHDALHLFACLRWFFELR